MNLQRYIQSHQTDLTVISASLIVIGFLSRYGFGNLAGYNVTLAVASIIAVVPIAIHAYQALRVRVISIDLLVTIAVIGAFIIGEYNESAIVTFLFLFGAYLEQRTLNKTRESIKTLTEMAPTTALVIAEDGTTTTTDVDDVEIGDHVLVKTGANVPVDGQIIDGTGYFNEAVITGESKVVSKRPGDSVFAGAMLSNGTVTLTATQVGEDTTFGKIIELVEDAQDTKSKAESFIDRFAQYYTPAVLIIAVLVYLFTHNFETAITVLVLGCLVRWLSAPPFQTLQGSETAPSVAF